MPDRPNWRRDLNDLVARRAQLLDPPDRALLLAALDRGCSIHDLAAMIGESPRAVRRRVRNLTRRVLSQRFDFVARNHHSWPAVRQRIAVACILHGRPVKDAAAQTGTSYYNARKQLEAIQTLLETLTAT